MLTLFIADDESNIREGLHYILDWNSLGIEIIGEASDGQEALNRINQLSPDIVMIDIRMPKFSGLEVINKCHESGYTGHYIILSGYSDFEYAKQAMRLGVTSYLTKPVIPEELKSTILSLQDQIYEKRSSVFGNKYYQRKSALNLVRELITGICTPEDFPIHPSELQSLKISAEIYQIVLYENFYIEKKEVRYHFSELLNTTDSSLLFEYYQVDKLNIIMLRGKSTLLKFQRFLERYSKNQFQMNSPLDSLFITYGRPIENLTDIHQSYKEAFCLLARRFFCSQYQHILGYEALPHINIGKNQLSIDIMKEYYNKLSDNLLTFNRPILVETLFDLSNYLYNSENNVASIKLFLTDIYFKIMEKIKMTFSSMEIAFLSHSQILKEIDDKHFLYEIILFLSEQFEIILKTTGSPDSNSIIEDIQYYIKHNYQNNIHLDTIAPLFGYNSCYLGRLFNQTIGETFNNYLDRIRIEKAKELLLDDSMRIYQISKFIGYANVEYFYSKFKKLVGDTPSNYRRKIFYE